MDVKLPDGRVITNVPEGTTKAQLMAKLGGTVAFDQMETPQEEEPSFIQSVKSGITNMVNPPKEDIGELPYIYQGGGQPELEMYRQKDPTAQMTQDEHGNTVFEGEGGRFYPDKPGFTMRDIPQFQTDATEFLQKAAPSVAGGAATAGLKAGTAIPAMFGVGAASGGAREGVESTLEGRDYDVKVPLMEGAIDAGGEGVARGLFYALKPLAARIWGPKAADVPMVGQDGTLTDDGMALLERAKSVPEAPDLLDSELAKMTRSGALSPEEAKRAEAFIKRGLEPTRSDVTRTADDWTAQQNMIKRSSDVRNAVEGQDVAIRQQMEELRPDVSGGAPKAYDDIRSTVEAADNEIREAYRLAREGSPDAKFRLDSLSAKLDELTASGNREAMDIAAHMRADLTRKGLTQPDNMINTGANRVNTANRTTVDAAESVRQQANGPIFESSSPYQRQILREAKDAIDDDVQRAIGDDIFGAARGKKAELEQSIDRTKQGGRDNRRNRGLVRDIVDNNLGREDIGRKIKGVATRAEDIHDLRTFLTDNGMEESWQAIRRDVLDDIIEVSFKGAEGEQGVANITREKLGKALGKYSDDKMAVLFDDAEREFFKDMQEIMRYREPVTGRQQGDGPSAMAVKKVGDLIRQIPFMGDLGTEALKKVVEIAGDTKATRQVLESGLTHTGRALTNAQHKALQNVFLDALRPQVTPLGGVAAGSVIGSGVTEPQQGG